MRVLTQAMPSSDPAAASVMMSLFAESIKGKWYCSNFFGDSFEVTAFNDGSLIVEASGKSLPFQTGGIRLLPTGDRCWEAENKFRLRQNGKTVCVQYQHNKAWSTEVRAFRTKIDATGQYFRRFFRMRSSTDEERYSVSEEPLTQAYIIERESGTKFKVKSVEFGDIWHTEPCTVAPTILGNGSSESSLVESLCDGESAQDPEDCQICMARLANVVFAPCGHGGVCGHCIVEMSKQSAASVKCPFCRQKIQMAARVDGPCNKPMLFMKQDLKPLSAVAGEPPIAWAQ